MIHTNCQACSGEVVDDEHDANLPLPTVHVTMPLVHEPEPDVKLIPAELPLSVFPVLGYTRSVRNEAMDKLVEASAGLYLNADEDPNCYCTSMHHEPDCRLQ